MNPPRRVTIREVAQAAGVSLATVSKVLNDRDGVAAATADRVRAVIDELGYQTSFVARSLRTGQTDVVGVLVADIEPFSTEVLKGVADVFRGTGYELVAYAAATRLGEHIGWEQRQLTRLGGTLIDGAVLVTPTVTNIVSTIPVVAVDPHTGQPGLPVVDADNLHGGYLAGKHLIELGHQDIAMLTGRSDLVSARLREQGFRAALAEAGVPSDQVVFAPGDFDPDVAEKTAHELLSTTKRPTAIFAANDATALVTIEVARRLGLDVPHDLSIVGFDNVPEAAMSTPGLTTVEQPIREMGRRAAKMLLDRLGPDAEGGSTEHVQLETRLVLRSSTAAR
jgi:LacI family transcriptional regulator